VPAMSDWATTAITVAGPLAGIGLGYLGSARIAQKARDAERERELRRALGRYLGALYSFVGELRDMPAVESGWFGQLIDRLRGEAATYVISRRGIQTNFGNRPFAVSDRLADAFAQLQVLELPPGMEEAERLADQRTPKVKAEWSEVYARLHSAIRATCGATASGEIEAAALAKTS
jgi:hypothetical protein